MFKSFIYNLFRLILIAFYLVHLAFPLKASTAGSSCKMAMGNTSLCTCSVFSLKEKHKDSYRCNCGCNEKNKDKKSPILKQLIQEKKNQNKIFKKNLNALNAYYSTVLRISTKNNSFNLLTYKFVLSLDYYILFCVFLI